MRLSRPAVIAGALAAAASGSLLLSVPSRAQEAEGPSLVKSTLLITTNRVTSYTAAPGKKVLNQWCWRPRVFGHLLGPVGAGTQVVFTFTKPGGKPWLTAEVKAPQIEKGDGADIELDPFTIPEEKAAIETGLYGVTIGLKNELEQKNTTLFTGKLKIGKFHVGNNLPQFKNQFDYFTDWDWSLPIAYMGANTGFREAAPPVTAAMWFKSPPRSELKVHGYLFHKGKMVCNTEDGMLGTVTKDFEVRPIEDVTTNSWKRAVFHFNMTATTISDPNGLSKEIFALDKNPGEYEIRVLWDGKLSRSLKFTVGEDGKIVDPGVSAKNKIGGWRTIFPVKVIGTQDGTYNAEAWKTEAFYFNPLQGFTPAP